MKIEKIETFSLKAPIGTDSFYSSQSRFPERTSLLVKITADDGTVGWGEGGQYGPTEPVASCINDILAPMVLAADPRRPVRIWEELYGRTRDFGRKGTYVEAISAIDVALWDIKGKAAGVPVHELLGGASRETVSVYATGCYYTEEDIRDPTNAPKRVGEEAAGYALDGYTALKIKIGLLPVKEDADRAAAIRATVGEEIPLLADANHAYRTGTALEMGRHLEAHNYGWFEEPVVPENRDGYRALKQSLDLQITGGECEFTRFGFRQLFDDDCVDIAQPDVCASGGLSEFVKILSLALSHDVLIVPHVWGSGVAVAAALQAIAIIPPTPYTYRPLPLVNEPVLEFDRKRNPLRDEILETSFIPKEGKIEIPQKPGLGIQVNEEIVRKFAT